MESEEDIESLRNMFPSHSIELIRATLVRSGYSVEEAVYALLAGASGSEANSDANSSDSNPSPLAKSTPATTSSFLRKGLKDYINNERFADTKIVAREVGEGEGGDNNSIGSSILQAADTKIVTREAGGGGDTNNNNSDSGGAGGGGGGGGSSNVLQAHAAILWARSVIFESLLESTQGDKITLNVDIDRDNLLTLLEYLYTDGISVDLQDDQMHNLLGIADEYCIPRLREICEQGDVSPSTYVNDMKRLFSACNSKECRHFDVTFVVGGEEIRAHKMILARSSEYFRAMFLGSMKEAEATRIDIEDTPHATFKSLLQIIYSDGEVTFSPDQVLEYFVASARFMLPELQEYCEEILKKNMTVDNVCDIIECSWGASDRLTKICTQYILKHFEEVKHKLSSVSDAIRSQIEVEFETNKDSALQVLFGNLSAADYHEISESIKMEVCSFMNTRLNELKISDTEGELDSPVGSIACSISNVGISIKNTAFLNYNSNVNRMGNEPSSATFNSDNVKVDITANMVDITVENFSCCAGNAIWWFEQQSFPKISDSGAAEIWLNGCKIFLSFDIHSAGLGIPAIGFRSCEVEIQDVDINIQQTNFKFLYNLLVRLLKSKIKTKICEEVKRAVQESLVDLTSGINKLGSQLLEEEEGEEDPNT